MIQANVNQEKARILATGDSVTLAAETLVMVRKMYDALRNADPEAAEQYKMFIIRGVADPNTPTWED